MIEDHRPHANQHLVGHRAAMDDRSMPDCYTIADSQIGIGVGMQHRAILDVRASADCDHAFVAANDYHWPDARVGPDADSAMDVGMRRDEGGWVYIEAIG